jgi:hypothetical protein
LVFIEGSGRQLDENTVEMGGNIINRTVCHPELAKDLIMPAPMELWQNAQD